MPQQGILKIIAAEGEGQKVEFKAKMTGLASELVSFANASGGSVFVGISDDGKITGVEDSNRLRSQIQDIANGCDPRIPIRIVSHGKVIEIVVPEDTDKPSFIVWGTWNVWAAVSIECGPLWRHIFPRPVSW